MILYLIRSDKVVLGQFPWLFGVTVFLSDTEHLRPTLNVGRRRCGTVLPNIRTDVVFFGLAGDVEATGTTEDRLVVGRLRPRAQPQAGWELP